jgi:carnitine 3-dehydrogenase
MEVHRVESSRTLWLSTAGDAPQLYSQECTHTLLKNRQEMRRAALLCRRSVSTVSATSASNPSTGGQENIAIVGAGTIGCSWAAAFLARGHFVTVWDPDPGFASRARDFVGSVWPTLAELGLAEGADPARMSCHETLAEALRGATFVQENAPESVELKQQLIMRIDRQVPADVVIASSSTAIPTSEFQTAATCAPGRIVLGHPFNPPHLMPLVEVGGGKLTEPWAVDWAMAFYERAGKSVVRLRSELPGHLANRLQAAVYREAVYLVEGGHASVEDVDLAMCAGPGLRWAMMGPHLTYHLGGGAGGLEHYLKSLGPSQERRWASLGAPRFDSESKAALVAGVHDEVRGLGIDELSRRRDATLLRVLKAIAEDPVVPKGDPPGGQL